MCKNEEQTITDLARRFVEPRNATHRQYEALRAYFVEGRPSTEVAREFGYTPGSFRVICHKFRRNPDRQFFVIPPRGRGRPGRDKLRESVVALRKQNLSIYDISQELGERGHRLSPKAVSLILTEEGFARLPRRREDERPPTVAPEKAHPADVRYLDLSPRTFRTKFGGLFLFLPMLVEIGIDECAVEAGLPGSNQVPAGHALRALLGLKLFGSARHSHVMGYVFDEGLGLFAGLNVIPKRSFLTEYSSRVDPICYPLLNRAWFDRVSQLGLGHGVSFDLDFHTIPFHGEDALVEKHYVSKRSRRQKGMLAFLAHDADRRVLCYANADLRKSDQNDEVLRFADFWKGRTGHDPEELIFDSKLTTYSNLERLDERGVKFVTPRRRTRKILEAIARTPNSAFRRVQLKGVSREYRTPRVLDERIQLRGCSRPFRQLTVMDLGHEDPTLLLTNHERLAPATLITRYAGRMIIENEISDGIDFFHMDALSSTVALKVNCDLQLTLMASTLYRLLANRIGNNYNTARWRTLFRNFVDFVAYVTIADEVIEVRFNKKAHNPLLLAAGFGSTDIRVPWLGDKRLRLTFG